MSKEDVKRYLHFLTNANRPLYEYEKEDIREELKKLESKLSVKDFSNIKLCSDLDLCERYKLKPNDINPKYVHYVLSKKDKIQYEEIGNVIISTEHKVLRDDMKTDFVQMKEDLMKQLGE